jgi:serine protease Do
MNQNRVKTPKTVFAVFAVGIVVGGLAMASIQSGRVVTRAFADGTPVRTISNVSPESMAALKSLNDSFASLAEYISPAVVHIKASSGRQSDVMGNAMPMDGGEGSGVIIRADGWILTNDHVVGGFDNVTVVLEDGREFSGKVTRSDYSDLAVVKIEAKDLPTVSFADSNKVRVGQYSIAVGSPFGLENSVTIGHVSALGRDSAIADVRLGQARVYPDLIQTDAAINRGNSGGPLLDIEGRVIGINTAIYSGTGGSVGIGFAIPANQARLTADMLINKGKIVRGYMGMVPKNLRHFRLKELGITGGAEIESFSDQGKSPARDAGLKVGDVILRINNFTVASQADVRNAMLVFAPGETVTIEYIRGKERKTVQVKLLDGTTELSKALKREQARPNNAEPSIPNLPDFEIPDLPQTPRGEIEDSVPPVREGQARLGVAIRPIDDAARKQYNIPSSTKGVVIQQVEPGSVAERLGLIPGDVISKIGNTDVASEPDVRKAMEGLKWGDSTSIRWSRFGKGMSSTTERNVKFR